jgi:hypothetical protein
MKYEHSLMLWKRELPKELQRCSWPEIPVDGEEVDIFQRLSLIINLRYLHVRIQLHKPILAKFLDSISPGALPFEENEYLNRFGHSHVEACIDSATQIILIVSKAEKRFHLLGAWWFSTFYSTFEHI